MHPKTFALNSKPWIRKHSHLTPNHESQNIHTQLENMDHLMVQFNCIVWTVKERTNSQISLMSQIRVSQSLKYTTKLRIRKMEEMRWRSRWKRGKEEDESPLLNILSIQSSVKTMSWQNITRLDIKYDSLFSTHVILSDIKKNKLNELGRQALQRLNF